MLGLYRFWCLDGRAQCLSPHVAALDAQAAQSTSTAGCPGARAIFSSDSTAYIHKHAKKT
eukprot:4973928-Amphidinium_carterae.1